MTTQYVRAQTVQGVKLVQVRNAGEWPVWNGSSEQTLGIKSQGAGECTV